MGTLSKQATIHTKTDISDQKYEKQVIYCYGCGNSNHTHKSNNITAKRKKTCNYCKTLKTHSN